MIRIIGNEELEFNGLIYRFERLLGGTMAITFKLDRDKVSTILKLTGKKSSESEILPYLQTHLPKEFIDRVSQLLSSGKIEVEWNDYFNVGWNFDEYEYVHLTYLSGQKPYHCPNLVDQLLSVLELLVEINQTGVLHSDIRTDNVIIDNNVAKLIDFGQSQFINRDQDDQTQDDHEIDDMLDLFVNLCGCNTFRTVLSDPLAELCCSDINSSKDIMTQIIKKYF